MSERSTKNSKRRIVWTIVISLLVIALGTTGGLLAKYRMDYLKEANMIAENFHISSNYLDEQATIYAVSDWNKGINILLYNYEKENSGLVAGSDISYEISIPSNFVIIVTDENGAAQVANNGKYTIIKKENGTYHNLRILPRTGSNIDTNQLVEVKVTTTNPFKKSLTARFNLEGEQGINYMVENIKPDPNSNDGNYYIIKIYTNHYTGSINVTWPSDLIPDNTNDIMRDWVDTITNDFNGSKFTTYELIFFNPQGSVYDVANFTIVTE